MNKTLSTPVRGDPAAGASLRQWLRATQAGGRAEYRDLLLWTAERGRQRGASEDAVQRALMLLDRLRHTYDPRCCPLRWIDAILDASGRGAAHGV